MNTPAMTTPAEILRQLVAQRYVEVDATHFNVLHLTDTSRAVLTGKQTVMLRKELPGKKLRERDRGPRGCCGRRHQGRQSGAALIRYMTLAEPRL